MVLQELGGILTLKKTLRLQQDRWSSAKRGSCGASYQGGGRGESKLGCGCCLWERRGGIRTAASENQRQIERVTRRFVALSQRHEKKHTVEKKHKMLKGYIAAIISRGKCLQRRSACLGSCENLAVNEVLPLRRRYVLLQPAEIKRSDAGRKGKKKIKGRCLRFFLKGSTFTRKAHPRRWRACVRANYKCMYSPIDSYHMLKSIVAVAG